MCPQSQVPSWLEVRTMEVLDIICYQKADEAPFQIMSLHNAQVIENIILPILWTQALMITFHKGITYVGIQYAYCEDGVDRQ